MNPAVPAEGPHPTVLMWHRHDLRLHDQPALQAAVESATAHGAALLGVVTLPPGDEASPWGDFARVGPHRRAFQAQALLDLRRQWQARGSELWLCEGEPVDGLAGVIEPLSLTPVAVHTQDVQAPYELSEVRRLQSRLPAPCKVRSHWGCSAIDPDALPFPPRQLPKVFTPFRQLVEAHRLRAKASRPTPAPTHLNAPPPTVHTPEHAAHQALLWQRLTQEAASPCDARSAFPWSKTAFRGGETAAQHHLTRYLNSADAPRYKQTRNGLIGSAYSSKWSPWLAQGALSGRQILAALDDHDARHGVNEGSDWLWFEMLWRDYFRFLMRAHGRQLFLHRGLSTLPRPRHDEAVHRAWREGRTGHAFVDAGMRELAATGYLSNRMRQVVASFFVHDLAGDWRAGAAWFEHCLIDFDVYSNQGNWLYIAGRGTDPRAGRRFNPDKQAADHDPSGTYRRLWAA